MHQQEVWTRTEWHIRAKRRKNGFLTVSVSLFGDTLNFLVDSGTAYSILSQRIVERHDLPLLSSSAWFSPSGNRTISPRVQVPLRLGGSSGIEFVVTALVMPIPDTFAISGFLGADVLQQYDVLLAESKVVFSQRLKGI